MVQSLQGLQDAVLTVRKDAAFGVTVNGVSAMPVKAKSFNWIWGSGTAVAFLFSLLYPALLADLSS